MPHRRPNSARRLRHQITDLTSIPDDENDNVPCPPHGLAQYRENGKLVKVYPLPGTLL